MKSLDQMLMQLASEQARTERRLAADVEAIRADVTSYLDERARETARFLAAINERLNALAHHIAEGYPAALTEAQNEELMKGLADALSEAA